MTFSSFYITTRLNKCKLTIKTRLGVCYVACPTLKTDYNACDKHTENHSRIIYSNWVRR